MTGDLEDDLPLRGRGHGNGELDDEPYWKWWALGIGLSLLFFGGQLILMGALMSESTSGAHDDYVQVVNEPVASWLYWLAFGLVVAGLISSLPGYRATFGQSRQFMSYPSWVSATVVVVLLGGSMGAEAVALAAAPHNRFSERSYWIVGFVWLCTLFGMVIALRRRVQQSIPQGTRGW